MSRSSSQAPVSASGAADAQRPAGQPDLSSGTPTTSGRNSGGHLSGSGHRPAEQRDHGGSAASGGRRSSSLGPAAGSAGHVSGGVPASLHRRTSGQPHSSSGPRGGASTSHAPFPAAAAVAASSGRGGTPAFSAGAAGSGELIAGRSPAAFWGWVATFRERQGPKLRGIIATQEDKDPPVQYALHQSTISSTIHFLPALGTPTARRNGPAGHVLQCTSHSPPCASLNLVISPSSF